MDCGVGSVSAKSHQCVRLGPQSLLPAHSGVGPNPSGLCGREARVCSCVGPVSDRPVGVRPICAHVWSQTLVNCGVGPISAKGHQCVRERLLGLVVSH